LKAGLHCPERDFATVFRDRKHRGSAQIEIDAISKIGLDDAIGRAGGSQRRSCRSQKLRAADLIESGQPLYLLVFIAFSSINRQPLDRKML